MEIVQPALLIADPHTLLCEAIANAARNADYTDVRTASTAHDVFKLLSNGWKPEIFLLDLSLVAPNDFELLDEIQRTHPRTSITIMMDEEDEGADQLVVRAFTKGALGLVSKARGVASLLRVLEVVRDGEAAIPRSLARSVVDALRYGPALIENEVGLSNRQREVLALVAQGLTDRDISRRLQIGMPTVRTHVEAIFEKTGTHNRTAAARWVATHLHPQQVETNPTA